MKNIDFNKHAGLVPVVIQDNTTLQVLMVGFMNEEALTKTVNEGKVTFFSRTKNRLWTKGETSGNFLYVKEIYPDCDSDSLLRNHKSILHLLTCFLALFTGFQYNIRQRLCIL